MADDEEGGPKADEVPVPVFKPRPGRSFRKRRAEVEPDIEADAALEPESLASLHAMRTLQRGRQRARGVILEAKGELELEDQIGAGDDESEEPGDVAAVLGATFTQQTDAGDVDPNMLRYIEEAMGKDTSKGSAGGGAGGSGGGDGVVDEEAELYKTPEFMLAATKKSAIADEVRDREDAQRWLTGIEEVQLSTEDKLFNIEQTERAKAKMLERLESKMRRTSAYHERERGQGQDRGERPEHNALPGNFTSNFHMHRKSKSPARARGPSAAPRDVLRLSARSRAHHPFGPPCAAPPRACARTRHTSDDRRLCDGTAAKWVQASVRGVERAGWGHPAMIVVPA
jgi:hypothetical protein